MSKSKSPYDEGYDAYLGGVLNPYPVSSDEYNEWYDGWNEAEGDWEDGELDWEDEDEDEDWDEDWDEDEDWEDSI